MKTKDYSQLDDHTSIRRCTRPGGDSSLVHFVRIEQAGNIVDLDVQGEPSAELLFEYIGSMASF